MFEVRVCMYAIVAVRRCWVGLVGCAKLDELLIMTMTQYVCLGR